MVERRGIGCAGVRSGPRTFVFAALLLTAPMIGGDRALAQLNVQPPPTQASPAQPQPAAVPAQSAPQMQPAPPAPPPKKEGFFDALGKWWDQSAADFDANLKKMKSDIDAANERNAKAVREATQGAATATKEATDAITKLSTSRIVEGKERCTLAPNGSPDCGPAAEAICKAKGYKTGQSANVESARKCSARALLTRNDADCTNETIVTRAACQ
jgi:hypothetical protein